MKLTHLKNIILLVVYIIYVFIGSYFLRKIEIDYLARGELYPRVLLIAFFVSFGSLIGVNSLVLEARKIGRWKIEKSKLILVGIPLLYLSMQFYIYYSTNALIRKLAIPMNSIFIGKYTIALFQVLLGYTIITSFKKIKK